MGTVCVGTGVSSGADTLRSSHPSVLHIQYFQRTIHFPCIFLVYSFAFFRLCVVGTLHVCVTNPTCIAGETILQHIHAPRHPNKTPSLQLHIHSKHKQNRSWNERSASPTTTRHVCACACSYASGMSVQHQFIRQLLRSLSLLILFEPKNEWRLHTQHSTSAPNFIIYFGFSRMTFVTSSRQWFICGDSLAGDISTTIWL